MPKSSKLKATRDSNNPYNSTRICTSEYCTPSASSSNPAEFSNLISPLNTELEVENLADNLENIKLETNNCNNSDNFENNLETKMTSLHIDPLQILKGIPEFDGSPGTLNNFITQIDLLIQLIPSSDIVARNVFNIVVRNKIIGDANNTLISIGNPFSWDIVKTHLSTYYSDRRSLDLLKRKLTELVQRHKPIEDYYSEASDLQTALINTIEITASSEERTIRTQDYIKDTLREFINGMDEHLSLYVRTRNPTTLKDAYEYARSQQNYLEAHKTKLGLRQLNVKQHLPNQRHPTNMRPIPRPNFSPFPISNFPQTNFQNPPFQNHQFSRPTFNMNPHQNQQNPFLNPRPINFQPQRFAQPLPPNQNRFTPKPSFPQPNQNKTLPTPTPMDISTQTRINRPVGHSFFSNNGQRPNFYSKELHTQETTENNHPETSTPYNNDQNYNSNYFDPTYYQYYQDNQNLNQNYTDNSEPDSFEVEAVVDDENFRSISLDQLQS